LLAALGGIEMDTGDLIKVLAADTRRPRMTFLMVWWRATSLAIAVATAVFFLTLGPRPDIAAAAETPRFLFKFVVTIALAASAFSGVCALSRPEETGRNVAAYLAAAPVLLGLAVIVELLVLLPVTWPAKLIGINSKVCLFLIPLIGIGPLAIFLMALRHSAPMRPYLAGAVAGLLAGAIAATFYAAHCTDDSPLFVATWYTIAIVALAFVGAASAYRLARW
jgi:hypothetical protein